MHLSEASSICYFIYAFKRHQLYHPLCEPGTADLTADVNFSYLKKIIDNRVTTLGPISQNTFLQNMGITVRLQVNDTAGRDVVCQIIILGSGNETAGCES